MKKTNENWKALIPTGRFGPHLFSEFEKRARAAASEVFRIRNLQEATGIILDIARESGARKIVSVENPLIQEMELEKAVNGAGMNYHSDQEAIAAHASTADIGVSGVEFGIAETGSICQDAYAIENRLVSSLPPIHIAFLDGNLIVPGIGEAFEIVSKAFDRGYVTFITGPSRTADIEVVLTIGVHGPVRLIIIAIDRQPAEWDAK